MGQAGGKQEYSREHRSLAGAPATNRESSPKRRSIREDGHALVLDRGWASFALFVRDDGYVLVGPRQVARFVIPQL